MRIVLAGVFTVFLLVWALPSKAGCAACGYVDGERLYCKPGGPPNASACKTGRDPDTGVAFCFTIGACDHTKNSGDSSEALVSPGATVDTDVDRTNGQSHRLERAHVRLPDSVREEASSLAMLVVDSLLIEDRLWVGSDINGIVRLDDIQDHPVFDGELQLSGKVLPNGEDVLKGRFAVQANGEALETVRFSMTRIAPGDLDKGMHGLYEFVEIR